MGLSGWVVWSHSIFFSFTFFSHYYIVLLWFLSHCPAHIDISKLKCILLFSTYQCAALRMLSEGTRDSLRCKGMPLGVLLCGTFLL